MPAPVQKERQAPRPVIAVKNLSLAPSHRHGLALKNISFSVGAGEIFGIAGIAGNGQNALLEALSGERPLTKAQADWICLKDIPVAHLSVIARRRMGLACVPEDRHGHGAVGDLTLTENILLTSRQASARGGWIRLPQARKVAEEVLDSFAIQGAEARRADTLARTLSGGNLQRFIVGRGLLCSPDLLAVLQPTWGVDAHAGARIHQALRAAAERGAGVLMISQDLDELLALSHRIAVLARGQLSPAFVCADYKRGELRSKLGYLMSELREESEEGAQG